MRGTNAPIGMNESAARDVVLLRAFESEAPDETWSDDDWSWASRAAAESVGTRADPGAFVARRAALGVERLGRRHPRVEQARHALEFRPAIPWLVAAVAFAAGVAMDAIGPAHRVNILSFPLLALLVWNLFVYLVLAVGAVRAVGAVGAVDGAKETVA